MVAKPYHEALTGTAILTAVPTLVVMIGFFATRSFLRSLVWLATIIVIVTFLTFSIELELKRRGYIAKVINPVSTENLIHAI